MLVKFLGRLALIALIALVGFIGVTYLATMAGIQFDKYWMTLPLLELAGFILMLIGMIYVLNRLADAFVESLGTDDEQEGESC